MVPSNVLNSYFGLLPTELMVSLMIQLKLRDRLRLAKAYPELICISQDSILNTRVLTCSEAGMDQADLEMILDVNGTKVQVSLDFKKNATCKVELAINIMELMPNLSEVTLKRCNIVPFVHVNCALSESCSDINSFWNELLSRVHILNIDSDCQVAYGKLSEVSVWSCMATLFRKHLNREESNLQTINISSLFPALSFTGFLRRLVSSRAQFDIVGKIHLSVESREGQVLDMRRIICAGNARWNFIRHYLCFCALFKTIRRGHQPRRLYVPLTYDSISVKKDGFSGGVRVEICHDFEMARFKRKLEKEFRRTSDVSFANVGPPPSNFY